MDHRFIDDSSLEEWRKIDSGGFGNVYRVRHNRWCSHVAIKLLRTENSTSLLREITMMLQGSSPHVIQVLGIFRGQPPFGQEVQHGLVMELMERGSLSSLQKTLPGTPPWPLVTRLAHQVALGTNFLHNLRPPLLHLDLKPSNVLLDPSLNAKLTDFGLSKCYYSNTRLSRKDSEEGGGTTPYMPPEAFDLSYKPKCSSDIYSYGILLWSIITWKPPYPNPISSIIRLQIPNGQRPSLDEISSQALGGEGLAELTDLMKRCWDGIPDQRPTAIECTTETEKLYQMHKHEITDVVHQVLKKLDQQEDDVIEQFQGVQITGASAPCGRPGKVDDYRSVPTGKPPVQEMAGGRVADQKDGSGFKGKTEATERPQKLPGWLRDFFRLQTHSESSFHLPATKSERDLKSHQSVKASSVHPILTRTTSPSPSEASGRSAFSRIGGTSNEFMRWLSFPRLVPCIPQRHEAEYIKIDCVTGLQYGNNNTMNIDATDPHGRKRHPSAPPSVNSSPLRRGSRRDKTGG